MHLDKLDGRIDNAFYDRMSAQWRTEQTRLIREVERHGSAEESYMEDGVRLLELARNVSRLLKQPRPEKKRLQNLVLSNSEWDRGEVRAVSKQPFDLLSQTIASAAAMDAQITNFSTGHPVWLGNLDTTIVTAPKKPLSLQWLVQPAELRCNTVLKQQIGAAINCR